MLDLELGRTEDYMKGVKIGLINIVKGSYKGLFIGGINNIQKRASNKKTTAQLESGSFTGGIKGKIYTNRLEKELKNRGFPVEIERASKDYLDCGKLK